MQLMIDWEIDYHRERVDPSPTRTLRSQLFKISGSKCPNFFGWSWIYSDNFFLRWRMEPRKWKKDDWRAVSGPEKRFDKQWKGRTVFKIKAGAALPAEELSHVKSSSKPARISDPSDEAKAWTLFTRRESRENLSQALHQQRKASPDRVRAVWKEDLVVKTASHFWAWWFWKRVHRWIRKRTWHGNLTNQTMCENVAQRVMM